jgi:hypothetical protein
MENILNKIVYQMSKAKYILLQSNCPSMGRHLATRHNYWFPLKPRFYCWKCRGLEREREREKLSVKMKKLMSLTSVTAEEKKLQNK